MRIRCPFCGLRDRREFYYQGASKALERPEPEASVEEWDDYVHNRVNASGWHSELWQHEAGCGAWVVVERNLTTHEIKGEELAGKSG